MRHGVCCSHVEAEGPPGPHPAPTPAQGAASHPNRTPGARTRATAVATPMSTSSTRRGLALDLIALLVVVCGAVLSQPAASQDEPTVRARAPRPAGQDAGQEAAPIREVAPLGLPMTGLTDENAEQVVAALQGLADRVYTCATCGTSEDGPGECCETERAPRKQRILASVRVEVEHGRMLVMPREDAWLRLGEVRTALEPFGVTVDAQQLVLDAPVRLLVEGVAETRQAEALQHALEASEDFGQVAVALLHVEAGPRAFVYLTPGAEPVTFEAVSKRIRALEGLRVLDLAWTAPTPRV